MTADPREVLRRYEEARRDSQPVMPEAFLWPLQVQVLIARADALADSVRSLQRTPQPHWSTTTVCHCGSAKLLTDIACLDCLGKPFVSGVPKDEVAQGETTRRLSSGPSPASDAASGTLLAGHASPVQNVPNDSTDPPSGQPFVRTEAEIDRIMEHDPGCGTPADKEAGTFTCDQHLCTREARIRDALRGSPNENR